MPNPYRWEHSLILGVAVALAAPAWAQTDPEQPEVPVSSTTSECGQIGVDYTDEAGLILKEKIRRMDQAFLRSLSKFDECQDEPKSQTQQQLQTPFPRALSNITPIPSGAPGEAGSSSQSSDVQGDAAVENLPAGPSSVALGELSGNEPEAEPARQKSVGSGRGEGDEEALQQPSGSQDSASAPSGGTRVLGNSKLPEDIPSSDNDSILEAQIRQAAINEPDTELKKKLWNEYRKYKGLPPI